MSIFFDFHVGPSGRRFRRAVDGDRFDIELFQDRENTEKLFGDVDIGSLIELSVLSICMINEEKKVIGFMAVNDYPNVLGVDPADWETWIRNMYQRFYLSRNTLFIHFMCCKDSVIEYFLNEALVTVFRNDEYLLQIVLIASSECKQENLSRYQVFKKRNMCKYLAKREDDCEKRSHSLYVALRTDHCPKLKIRRAVEEDNDDICGILDKKCPRLRNIYGDYYISELIGRHPESNRKIIVAELHDKAVGVMCLSPNINYKKLQSIYELRPYYGLKKATPLEKEQLRRSNSLLSIFGEPIMLGKWSPFDEPPTFEKRKSDTSKENVFQENTKAATSKKLSKVYFERKESLTRHRKRNSSSAENPLDNVVYTSDDSDKGSLLSPPMFQITNNLNVLLDDDSFEYDIVNIDPSLITVAGNLSADFQGASMQSSRESSMQSQRSECPKIRKRASIYKPVSDKDTDQVIYRGEPNAFMIELFGLREDVDGRCAFDLLEVAFEVMKDYDYCIIRVPSAEQTFRLLQHFCLVPAKPRVCCVYSLYVAHRGSVLGKLRVREAEFIDIPPIARLFQNMQAKETIWTIENCILENRLHQAYVFTSGLSVVGVGILESPEQLNFLRAKFNIDPFHNHKYHQPGSGSKIGFSAVDVVLVYPVFEPHFRYFTREMMRLSRSNSLVWMTAYRDKWVAHKTNSLVSAMVPLLPRKSDIDFGAVPELLKLSAIAKNIMSFSTWFLDKKLTTLPMVNVTNNIVVLGASRTALAFLNTLLFGSSSTYLIFTNITLISAYGLPYMRHSNPVVELMFPRYHNNTDKYLKSVPYTYYVNVVQGTMTEINKADKYVKLTNGSKYRYDLLFLLFGKQYQHPDYLLPLSETNVKCDNYVRSDMRRKFGAEVNKYNTPENVFIVNNIGQANIALKYVRSCITEDIHGKVLVYGATIHAYCCLAALLEMDVPAENIVFIEPFPPEDTNKTRVSVFCNENVDETVSKVIDNLNIEVYRSYYFQSWREVDNYVTHVDFISRHHMVTLECSALFYYGKRGVNTEAFLAVNKCGMGCGTGILIDHHFRTKDPYIYAAGSATAYHRKYYAPTMKHMYYDSYDVGEKLGIQIRNQLDPMFCSDAKVKRKDADMFSTRSLYYLSESDPSVASSSPSSFSFDQASVEYEFTIDKLPKLLRPKVKYCQLPGGLQYLEVRSPGKKIPHHYLQSLNYSGLVMETFKSGYFKIHLTNDLVVDGLTCLTPDKYSVENFKNIYGLSSVVLNNVHLKYATKKLDDFYYFFRSAWAFFLYHDQADELFAMVKELLPKGQSEGDTIREALRKVCTRGSSTSSNIQVELRKTFDATPHLEAITEYVIEWLSENDVLLPMYLQPSQRSEFDHDTERNQVFRKKRKSIVALISKIV